MSRTIWKELTEVGKILRLLHRPYCDYIVLCKSTRMIRLVLLIDFNKLPETIQVLITRLEHVVYILDPNSVDQQA
jgi:hypothetical protein